MADQPEALRLAGAIEKAVRPKASLPLGDWARIAAELRRQHAEIERTQAERDALLEALRQVVAVYDGNHVGPIVGMSFDKARAAIAAVKGGSNG